MFIIANIAAIVAIVAIVSIYVFYVFIVRVCSSRKSALPPCGFRYGYAAGVACFPFFSIPQRGRGVLSLLRFATLQPVAIGRKSLHWEIVGKGLFL